MCGKMSPDAGTNVVDVYVNYLRRKLQVNGEDAELVETVRGAGYTIRPVAGSAALQAELPPKRPAGSAGLADAARPAMLLLGAA